MRNRSCYVLSTQNVIDELEVVLRQPDVIKSVCLPEWDEGYQNVSKCKNAENIVLKKANCFITVAALRWLLFQLALRVLLYADKLN